MKFEKEEKQTPYHLEEAGKVKNQCALEDDEKENVFHEKSHLYYIQFDWFANSNTYKLFYHKDILKTHMELLLVQIFVCCVSKQKHNTNIQKLSNENKKEVDYKVLHMEFYYEEQIKGTD